MSELRTKIREVLALWSLNGTTESESVDAVADELMELIETEIDEQRADAVGDYQRSEY